MGLRLGAQAPANLQPGHVVQQPVDKAPGFDASGYHRIAAQDMDLGLGQHAACSSKQAGVGMGQQDVVH